MSPYAPPPKTPRGTATSQDRRRSSPLTIRSLTSKTRIWVAPMCMYSANAGHLSDSTSCTWGRLRIAARPSPSIEATAVRPEVASPPRDAGLWDDAQVAGFRRVADFAHGQGQKIGVQLAHAGRKASTLPPWWCEGKSAVAEEKDGGWPQAVKGCQEWLDGVESWDVPDTIRLAKATPGTWCRFTRCQFRRQFPTQKIDRLCGNDTEAEAAKSHLEDGPATYPNAGRDGDVTDEQGKIAKADVCWLLDSL
ncbi:hypothetical protein EYC84_005823 [Monilinia fructicola]|uniref:NADH:flavin oxidoreductase/NADH oxidase N-terminal domain-containing protein n=1 Tax=Monilinia fructicola TaxID=38448 RepID=A0A5M9K2I0_MONFR|nr:hypothetical protein EYC84_005823 [Monilinia fructicola]